MKYRHILMFLLFVMMAGACEELMGLFQSEKETEKLPEGGGSSESQQYDPIGSITKDGDYTVQGTVVAVGKDAYVIADASGALMIYGSGHGRNLMEVVKVSGKAYRHQEYQTNVFQMKGVTPEVVSTGASWNYSPQTIDGRRLDSMVGGQADCFDVQVSGTLLESGNYLNLSVEGASRQASVSYVDNSLYASMAGREVVVKGFVVGTYNYLKILPYSVEVASDSGTGGNPGVSDDGVDPRGRKWMELPAMEDKTLGYYFHKFQMNGKTYRNYSFGWDDASKVAVWMAYPLCSTYSVKKVDRTDEWAKDPLLGDASPFPGPGYAGDYDRGHQVPSGDRLCCREANVQTFYGTNMTAQSNPLNGGPWAKLEGDLRDFAASSDTTYVVTGCYVKDSNEWTTDTDGMRLKVPTAYFKALLVLKGGNWTGGAYWTPHTGYSSDYKAWATSIDWLEQKTGIDFFVNLPEKIGAGAAAAIEAAEPGNAKWWK